MKFNEFWANNQQLNQFRDFWTTFTADVSSSFLSFCLNLCFMLSYLFLLFFSHIGYFVFWITSFYEFLYGLKDLIIKTNITFNDFWCNKHLHYSIIMYSIYKYRIYCLTLRLFYVIYYAFQVHSNSLNNNNVPIENFKIFSLTFSDSATPELLPIIELLLYKTFFPHRAKYHLLLYEYLFLIVPFAYVYNESHKNFWARVYAFFTNNGENPGYFLRISTFLRKTSLMIVNFGQDLK